VLALQSTCINSSELDAPKADCFSGYSDASFGQYIFDIAVTQVEPVVQPDCVGNDIGWESVALVCIHGKILAI
jgi:hypothetical protein